MKGSDGAHRLAAVALLLTHVEDGIDCTKTFTDQIKFLQHPGNYLRLPYALALVFIVFSLCTELLAGVYALFGALCTPHARGVVLPPKDGGWPFMRHALSALWLLVTSELLIYGLGGGAWMHGQGRLAYLSRNLAELGGLLLLLSSHGRFARARREVKFVARIFIAQHGFDLVPSYAPSHSLFPLWVIGGPLALLVMVDYKTKYAALALAVMTMVCSIIINHSWKRHEEQQFYFFEDLATFGGLLLLALQAAETEDSEQMELKLILEHSWLQKKQQKDVNSV